jgi:hypothetical protein
VVVELAHSEEALRATAEFHARRTVAIVLQAQRYPHPPGGLSDVDFAELLLNPSPIVFIGEHVDDLLAAIVRWFQQIRARLLKRQNSLRMRQDLVGHCSKIVAMGRAIRFGPKLSLWLAVSVFG